MGRPGDAHLQRVFRPGDRLGLQCWKTMNIYILRHASAGVRRPNPAIDRKRPLDKEGKRYCLQLAHVLNAMNLQFDLVVSSPLKRCLQTASLVGTETGYEARILKSAALAPEATFTEFHKLLRDCAEVENYIRGKGFYLDAAAW